MAIWGSDIVEIVGGVCRATATGSGSIVAGIHLSNGTASIKGGWLESDPKISDFYGGSGTTDHIGGALIVGDKGTVKGTVVIPEGMTATLREGVELTVEPGAKIFNDGELVLPASMTKEQINNLNITGKGEIFKGTEPIHADGEKNYDGAISAASKKFDASAPWRPEDGDWEIVVSMDSTVDIDGVSIDSAGLEKDAERSIKAETLGGISAKAETPRTVVITAETLSALVDETASKDHTLRITMTDDGYAELKFWVGTEKMPVNASSGGACSAGAATLVALASIALIKRRKR